MGKKKSLDLLRNRIKSKKGGSSASDDTDLVRAREQEQANVHPFIIENQTAVLNKSKDNLLQVVQLIRGGLDIDNDLHR